MKLGKYLSILFVSFCFLSNICLSVIENDPVEKIVHKKEEKVVEKNVEKKLEKLEKPIQQENVNEILTRPNPSDSPQENINNEPRQSEQIVEKPKKIQKKVQKKKIEDVNPEEQSSSESNNQEPNNNPTGVDLSKTDSSAVEFQEFRSKSPQQQDRDSKEYVIRGLVSMLLVIAGAILLVIVIITGVNNKKKRR